MRAYIAISFSNRSHMVSVLQAISSALLTLKIAPYIFVDQHHFVSSDEKQMMLNAFHEIDASDILIAELSHKAIGVGVEAGYAIGKNKSVIYIRHADAEHSTTVAGASDISILYKDCEDLKIKLINSLRNLLNKKCFIQ